MCFRFQNDIVVVLAAHIIIEVLGDFLTIDDFVVGDVILDEASGSEVNHHGLHVNL